MFREHSIADIEVIDPQLDLRMHSILTQIVAYRALAQALEEVTHPQEPGHWPRPFHPPGSLHVAIERAEHALLITHRQAGVLRTVNRMGNEAKHSLGFMAAL